MSSTIKAQDIAGKIIDIPVTVKHIDWYDPQGSVQHFELSIGKRQIQLAQENVSFAKKLLGYID